MGNLSSSQNQREVIFQSSQLVPHVSAFSPSSTRPRLLKKGFLEIDGFGSIPSNRFRSPSKKLMCLREDEIEALKGIHQSVLYLDGRIDELFEKLVVRNADNWTIVDEVMEHRTQIEEIGHALVSLDRRIWLME